MHAAPINSLDAAIERWSDRFNPVLVKEMRQVLKSRGFAGSFLVMLGLTFLASLVLAGQAGEHMQYGEPGRTFFAVYLVVLMLALCFVVPMSVFRSVATEFEHRTFESLAVTTLTPPRIIFGKLQGAFVQMAIYYSAVAPFVCFTYLIGGLSLPAIIVAMGITGLASLTACLGGVMLGSLTRGGTAQVITTLILLAGAGVVFVAGASAATNVAAAGIDLGTLYQLILGFLCISHAGLFYAMLTLGVAISQFSPTIPDYEASFAAQQRRRLALQQAQSAQSPNVAIAAPTAGGCEQSAISTEPLAVSPRPKTEEQPETASKRLASPTTVTS